MNSVLIPLRKTLSVRNRATSGFTLIEVMISLFILILIGTTTTKAVVEAAKLKELLKNETEFSSEIRTSIGFIERDLSQVFNPRWLLGADQKPLDPYAARLPVPTPAPGASPATPRPPPITIEEMNRKLRGQAFEASEYWGPVYGYSGIRPSRFKGDEKSMSFVTASHFRIYRERKESIYAKVRYELVPQRIREDLPKREKDKLQGLFQLIKIENTRAFELEEPRDASYIHRYVVLTHIRSLKFRYYKKSNIEASQSWDSEILDTKNQFPEAVELEIALAAPNDRTLEAKVLFKLEAPNYVLPKTY